MEKLTRKGKEILQAIKQHVAYGAPIEILKYQQDYVGIQYSKANGYYMLAGDIYVTYDGGSTGKSVKDFRFLLRPLSQLTEKEEWKRKLLSFLSCGRSDNYVNPIEIRTKANQATFKIRIYTYRALNNSELIEYTVYKDLDKRFTKYSLIEWAIENHFDVFGLIDRGLALPIEGKEVEGE